MGESVRNPLQVFIAFLLLFIKTDILSELPESTYLDRILEQRQFCLSLEG